VRHVISSNIFVQSAFFAARGASVNLALRRAYELGCLRTSLADLAMRLPYITDDNKNGRRMANPVQSDSR
jgi:hypothetical protein